MKNYNLDNENNYCVSDSEYNRMLAVIDEIKTDSDLMSNIQQTTDDIHRLITDLHKRPASDAKELGHDVDDYMERLIGLIQYEKMLDSVMENKDFDPFKFAISYIDERKKDFLKHQEILEGEMIDI